MAVGTFADNRVRWVVAIGLILALATVVLQLAVVFGAFPSTLFVWINDLSLVVLAGVVTALTIWLFVSFEWSEPHKLIWGTLALGILLWMFGESFWAYYELVLGIEAPYPSSADIGWAIGYVPLAASMFLRYGSLRRKPSSRRILLLAALFVIPLILSIVFVIGPIVTYQDYEQPAEQFLDVLYPVGDLVIAFAGLLVVMSLAGGTLARVWALMAAGFLVVGAADLFYTYGEWEEIYSTAGTNFVSAAANILYLLAYIVMAVGAFVEVRIQRLA